MAKKQFTNNTPRIRVGSHLRVRRRGYYHHGIYVGRRKVIHFGGKSSDWLSTGPIQEVSLDLFLRGAKSASDGSSDGEAVGEIVEYENVSAPDEIVSRARSRLGSGDYDLFRNNCEHFASWCVTGNASSRQVQRVTWVGPVGHLIHHCLVEG